MVRRQPVRRVQASMDIRTDEEILTALAQRARQARQRRKLSQSELAGKAGVSRTAVQRLEGTGEITLANLVRMSRALGLTRELDGLFEQPEFSPRDQFRALAEQATSKRPRRRAKSGVSRKSPESGE